MKKDVCRVNFIIAAIISLITIISSSCSLTRMVRYYQADIDDSKVFPLYELKKSDNPFSFYKTNDNQIETLIANSKDSVLKSLMGNLSKTSTRAFLVIRNDSVLFEKYYRGYKREDISTFFSVSKSVTSLLIGIAVDEGIISSIDDEVTKYIKELNDADPKFKKLTIRHLLNMRSGIKFSESYDSPFSMVAKLYYGKNQLGKIKRMKFEFEPGAVHKYQSVSTAILGLVIEKATGKTMAQYFEEKVWNPLRMENSSSWSLDDKVHRSTKAYCGLNATAVDLAKIGRLYLNSGNFANKQIVSKDWVNKSFTPDTLNDGYQMQWYSLNITGSDTTGNTVFLDSIGAVKCKQIRYPNNSYNVWKDRDSKWHLSIYTNQFFALGIMNQIMFVDPKKNLIIVRLGDSNDSSCFSLIYRLSRVL